MPSRILFASLFSLVLLNLLAQEPPHSFCSLNGIAPLASVHLPDKPTTPFAKSRAAINVRIVVHIVYNDPADNLDDEIVENWLSGLNDIFRAEIDSNLVHPSLRYLIGDTGIQFCLAKTDPSGNASTGITHNFTDSISFPGLSLIMPEAIKIDSLGGVSPWPDDQYLNVWIGRFNGNGNWGISYPDFFPIAIALTPNLIPGVVLSIETLENIPTPSGLWAHEMGHALGLPHTFGFIINPGMACEVDDFITDTPLCDVPATFCGAEQNSCPEAGADPVDNLANIMTTACLVMITPKQADTMRYNLSVVGPLGLTKHTDCGMVTNIEETSQINRNSLHIAPNPNYGSFNIMIPPLAQKSQLSLYELNGRLIRQENIRPGNAYRASWSLPLPTGVYLLRLNNGTDNIVKRVVINRN